MDKITFTLKEIRKHKPCKEGWVRLYKNLGGVKNYGEDTPITLRQLYEATEYYDVMWCLVTLKEHGNLLRHFAVTCASMVEHLMIDERSKNALVVARKHADSLATNEELDAAWEAADDYNDAYAAAMGTVYDNSWLAAEVTAKASAWAACDSWAAWAAQIDLLEVYLREGKRPDNDVQMLKDFYQKHLDGDK